MLSMLVVSMLAGVVVLGLELWAKPLTSLVMLAHGAVVGVLVAHACSQSLVVGLASGAAVSLVILGIVAFGSIVRVLCRPPSMASRSVWF